MSAIPDLAYVFRSPFVGPRRFVPSWLARFCPRLELRVRGDPVAVRPIHSRSANGRPAHCGKGVWARCFVDVDCRPPARPSLEAWRGLMPACRRPSTACAAQTGGRLGHAWTRHRTGKGSFAVSAVRSHHASSQLPSSATYPRASTTSHHVHMVRACGWVHAFAEQLDRAPTVRDQGRPLRGSLVRPRLRRLPPFDLPAGTADEELPSYSTANQVGHDGPSNDDVAAVEGRLLSCRVVSHSDFRMASRMGG